MSLLHLLEKMGVKIVPYYITREYLHADAKSCPEPGLKPDGCSFLSQSELETLYAVPALNGLRAEMQTWKDDCLCFGLRHNEETVAYVWCNLKRCNSNLIDFPLEPDEAYIFRARTLHAYRGRNLAPFLRYQLYKRI